MAAILEMVLENHIVVPELLKWLSPKREKMKHPQVLEELSSMKQEFVPYYLNFLRDQTSHLLQGCRSATTTPGKTPSSLKVKKQNLAAINQATSTPVSASSASRVRLFTSPLDSRNRVLKNDSSYQEYPSVSFSSRGSDTSRNTFTSSSTKKQPWRMSPHSAEPDIRQQRSIHFETTPEPQRSKHRPCLADFILTPDVDQNRKKSPHSGRKDESFSPVIGKRSSGKKKGERGRLYLSQQDFGPKPVLRITDNDEFPSLATKDKKTVPKDTASRQVGTDKTVTRRITTTLVSSPSLSPRNLSSFEKAASFLSQGNNTSDISMSDISSVPFGDKKFFRRLKGARGSVEKISFGEDVKPASVLSGSISDPPTRATTEKILASSNTTPSKGKFESSSSLAITPKKGLDRTMSLTEFVKAEKSEISHENQLELFAELYSGCIDEWLVPNVVVELYFIVQLLTARGGEMEPGIDSSQDADEMCYFTTVHNAVFFAVIVLAKQKRFISLLDKGTLRLLLDNQRIGDFLPVFKEELSTLHENCPARVVPVSFASPIGGVSFQADTDNKKNFPSDKSFNLFKKQRDTFYELIREWQDNHMTSGWSMFEVQGERIHWLVGQRIEIANHIHFARLFQSQLLQMCKGDSGTRTESGVENIALLSQLKQTNPDKFKRLQERFITPSTMFGPCPLPSFPGCQEFFRDFIIAASSHVFNQHLSNSMATKIEELNSIQLVSNSGEEEGEVDVEDRETLASCLMTLRILGKFLGFITFLPYQSVDSLPSSLQTDYISMRNKSHPCVDVLRYLQTAQREGRTLITVPWVVELLSMMDMLAPHLEYFNSVLLVLLTLYREIGSKFKSQGLCTPLLVVTILGWFFELPVFPEGLFFQTETETNPNSVSRMAGPDDTDLVDQQILYACCPYLGEVRNLLVEFAVGTSSRNNNNIRKITPVSAQTVQPTSLTQKQLQHQLEESFFHNHPASMKRTVEFVADRVASNYVKMFRASIFPVMLQQGHDKAQELAATLKGESLSSRIMRKLLQQLEDFAVKLSEKGRSDALTQTQSYCEEKTRAVLPLLLAEETSKPVLTMCARIACRMAIDKVSTWMVTHLTASMLRQELTGEFEKQVKAMNSCKPAAVIAAAAKISAGDIKISQVDTKSDHLQVEKHHDACCQDDDSPADILLLLKDGLKILIIDEEQISADRILIMLKRTKCMIQKREDVLSSVFRVMTILSTDLAATLVLRYPGSWSEELQTNFVNLWEQYLPDQSPCSNLLCPKNLQLIEASSNRQLAWVKLTELVDTLLLHNLISSSSLVQGGLCLLQLHATQEILLKLTECFTVWAVTYQTHRESSTGEEFAEVLDSLYQLLSQQPHLQRQIQTCNDTLRELASNTAHEQQTQIKAKQIIDSQSAQSVAIDATDLTDNNCDKLSVKSCNIENINPNIPDHSKETPKAVLNKKDNSISLVVASSESRQIKDLKMTDLKCAESAGQPTGETSQFPTTDQIDKNEEFCQNNCSIMSESELPKCEPVHHNNEDRKKE